jgi:hypothetical protein
MGPTVFALRLIDQEVAGLIGRVQMVRPFALNETMVAAAQPAGDTLQRIDRHLSEGRRSLVAAAQKFRLWLASAAAERARSESVYRQYVYLRLQVNAALTQFDLFADAITQRSEAETGVWMSGLDALARDALLIPSTPYAVPALLCYLDRGVGAAIRRARTRLPGGGENPVAIIRVPRERMVGLGIASSLVHEAGHQGAALMELVPALRKAMEPLLGAAAPRAGAARASNPWLFWNRWISEIVADLWSVSRLGATSTLGLMNVVSLPRVFVFRGNLDDPHPTPWIRVMLSAEMGRQLYPHPQWDRVSSLWRSLYPTGRRDVESPETIRLLEQHAPIFVDWLLRQAIPNQMGASISRSLADPEISPQRLDEQLERWNRDARHPERLRPCQAFALIGYSRLNRGRAPVPEIQLISRLLTQWAMVR